MIEHLKSADMLIFNDKGELALQLRAANDKSFPSHWDFSAGGGVDVGEEPEITAPREIQEELGVRADVEFVTRELFKYPAWKPGVEREVDVSIFKAHHNGPFNLNPVEVQKVEFFTLDKIAEMMASGEKFHPEFRLAWEKGIVKRTSRAS